MKKVLMSFLVFFVALAMTTAQETKAGETKKEVPKDRPIMKLETLDVDYGTIERNADPYREVKFTNVGNQPLVLKSVKGNCGCTVPTWPKDAIMPGKSEVIKIRYATNRIGPFHKKVTIITNEPVDNKHIIKVHGKVLKPEESKGVPEGKKSMLKNSK